jgi:hypothetical protein
MCIDVFGEEFEIAHLATSDGIGIEYFIPHGVKEVLNSILSIRVFSFCIQDPNIEDLIKIVSYGGKQRMPIREYYPKDKPFKMLRRRSLRNCFRNIHTQL